jgi:hypothetical protein
MPMKRYMVIEHFHEGALDEIYARFRASGRMLPADLFYLDSCLSRDGRRCFQLMESAGFESFAEWTPRWQDLADFEIVELGDKPAAGDASGVSKT